LCAHGVAFGIVSEAYDPLDPSGNITVKWDIITWTGDGYVVSIYISFKFGNFLNLDSDF